MTEANLDAVRSFLFRGLMFEADAAALQRAGVRIGSEPELASEEQLSTLDRFPIELRADALKMARLYTLLFCLENGVRTLISERLQELVGDDWWTTVQKQIRDSAESRQKEALENPWMVARVDDLIGFVEFGGLAKIITNNWQHFSDLIPSQNWLEQRFAEMERARNSIAHHRLLSEQEFQRLYMYVNDWVLQTS